MTIWEVEDYRKSSFDPETLRWPWWAVPVEFFPHYCVQVLSTIFILLLFIQIQFITVGCILWLDYYFYYRLKKQYGLSCHFIPFTFLMLTGLLLLVAT